MTTLIGLVPIIICLPKINFPASGSSLSCFGVLVGLLETDRKFGATAEYQWRMWLGRRVSQFDFICLAGLRNLCGAVQLGPGWARLDEPCATRNLLEGPRIRSELDQDQFFGYGYSRREFWTSLSFLPALRTITFLITGYHGQPRLAFSPEPLVQAVSTEVTRVVKMGGRVLGNKRNLGFSNLWLVSFPLMSQTVQRKLIGYTFGFDTYNLTIN